jgi:hypothetical protein
MTEVSENATSQELASVVVRIALPGMNERAVVEETDHASPFDRLTKTAALVITLLAVLIYFVLEHISDPARARVASVCAAMIATSIWMRWDLRNRVWFWVTIAILTVLHIPLVLLVPWTNNNYPGVVLLPEALLDLAIVYIAIKLAESVAMRQ